MFVPIKAPSGIVSGFTIGQRDLTQLAQLGADY